MTWSTLRLGTIAMIATSGAWRRRSRQISAVSGPTTSTTSGLEHTQEAGRTPALCDGEDVVSLASQGSRELGLRFSMNEQEPHPVGNNRMYSHG